MSNREIVNLNTVLEGLRAVTAAAADAMSDVQAIIDNQPPFIPDATFRVKSHTRYNSDHLVIVQNGKARCGCEAAAFHPEKGICLHVKDLIDMHKLPANVGWGGGLLGN